MLPVGLENFEDIIKSNYYYIDKTQLIKQLLSNLSKVNLFTRPRRFGKTLNMSMIKYFFEVGTDKSLFDGLYISNNKELCDEYMGKFPVIFLTLKRVEGLTFEKAKNEFIQLIGKEASRFKFLLESDRLDDDEKEQLRGLTFIKNGPYYMDEELLTSSLAILSTLLYHHYGQKTIILIDEYDVPLDKAFNYGYYREMASLMRVFLGNALKTNDSLQFAVLTGCLRVSKESIFTGLNNLNVNSIVDVGYAEQFGFTECEVLKLLSDYGYEEKANSVREWYDGYHFGNKDIYCPWDVIMYAYKLRLDPSAIPEAFWINTSGNDLVKRFISKADIETKEEIESLISGEAIEKKIRLDLTCDEIDNSIDNLWSVLFTTGYLTQTGKTDNGVYKLVIPNKEVREVFILQIQEWFKEKIITSSSAMKALGTAITTGDVSTIQSILNDFLWDSISIRDTAARKDRKENFYHGLLLGLLRSAGNWSIKSNEENGVGYSDITIRTSQGLCVVIELKYAEDGKLEAACRDALMQIKEKKYAEGLSRQGKPVICYGIAFYQKECMVAKA